MEITSRALWSLIHGMGFGGLYLLACSGVAVEIWNRQSDRDYRFLRTYLAAMALLAWLAVLSGTYVVYPWYRAASPAGASLADYPQQLLMSSASTSAWHSIGMEWKEHVAWLAPIAITMAFAVAARYGPEFRKIPHLRNAVLCFVAASFVAAGTACVFGAQIDAHAPVQGGTVFHLAHGK
jgi:hypothetical protein